MNTLAAQPRLPDHAWIAAHIPHSGAMCLLDAVLAWDDARIRCTASSHRDAANPLRAQGRLAAICGIEYAAQAMAVHGALLGDTGARPRAGLLASVRDVEAHVARLDTVDAPLCIEAERLGAAHSTILYRFALHGGERLLLTGRAAVMLDANGLIPGAAQPANGPSLSGTRR